MFKNIGSKIKGLAKFLFWIIVIGFAIAGLFTMYAGFRNDSAIGGIIGGILLAGFGVLLGWLQNFLLYGYGELIDCSQKILKLLEDRDVSRIVHSEPSAPVSQPAPQSSEAAKPLSSVVDQSIESLPDVEELK